MIFDEINITFYTNTLETEIPEIKSQITTSFALGGLTTNIKLAPFRKYKIIDVTHNTSHFNKETWEVTYKDKIIGKMKKNTQTYKFFHLLYINKWTSVSIQCISSSLWSKSMSETKEVFVAWIKKRIPEKIRELIYSNNGGYILPS